MRVTVSDPAAIPDLVAELRRSGCVADPGAAGAIEIAFPWIQTVDDARHAIVELVFFVRACEAARPGVSVAVDLVGLSGS